MLSIYDAASLDAALASPLDPRLRNLIERRIASARAKGLADMTHLVAVTRGDTARELVAELGWSPLVNPIDSRSYGKPGFIAPWDWLQRLDHYGWEMIVTVGDSGFAFILLIEDAEGVPEELLALCRHYSGA